MRSMNGPDRGTYSAMRVSNGGGSTQLVLHAAIRNCSCTARVHAAIDHGDGNDEDEDEEEASNRGGCACGCAAAAAMRQW